MLHDDAEHRRLEMLPLALPLGDGDEIGAEKHPGHPLDLEQPWRQRRFRRLAGRCDTPAAARAATVLPGMNFKVAGLGVASVWMNMYGSIGHLP